MNDKTAAATIDGDAVLIELDENTQTLSVRDEADTIVATYTLDVFAAVTGALALDLGAGLILDAETVAGIQQWARLDAPSN